MPIPAKRNFLAVTALVLALLSGCALPRDQYRYEEVIRRVPPMLHLDTAATVKGKTKPDLSFSQHPLTLEESIRVALTNNPDIQIALSRIRQAEATLAEASAAFLPVLDANTGYLRADAPSSFLFKTIDARSFVPGTNFNNPGNFGNFETGLTLRYNLYNGGQDLLRRRMAQTGKTMRELDLQETRNTLAASVIHAYYDIRTAEEFVRTAEASTKTIRAQLGETRAQWENGKALKSDVLSLEVRLEEAQERTIRAENSTKLAVAALANLLGGNADTPIKLSQEDWTVGKLPDDYNSALAEALAKRPELLRGRKMVENTALGLASARRSYLPRVDLSARVYWDDPNFSYDGDKTNWVTGVTLSWNLFEGGSRAARVARARAVLDEMLHADRKAALAVQLDVKTAYLRIAEARAREKVAESSVARALEMLSLVRKQFDGGTTTVTRYLQAELMLTRARMRNTNAIYDLKKSLADAARAVGWFGKYHGERGVRNENKD
ncbi:MAG: TolC family protein [Anaerolineales bacterium]|nr:TolC family protein [Anaerolineales bacterium]